MSVVNTLGAALAAVYSFVVTDPISDPGLPAPLGFRTKLAASEADKLLAVIVTSTGAFAGTEAFTRSLVYKEAAAGTYTDYTVPGGCGDQEWVLVANESGSTIQRGTALKYNTSSTLGAYSVVPMAAGDHTDECIGVAQWDIPDDYAAFVVCGGWAQALVGTGNIAEGEAMEFGVTGAAVTVSGVGVPSSGRAYTTTTATNIGEVILSLRK